MEGAIENFVLLSLSIPRHALLTCSNYNTQGHTRVKYPTHQN